MLLKNLGKLEDDSVEKILSCYESDLPSSAVFKQELRLWRRFWSSKDGDGQPSTVSETLEKIRANGVHLLYPNIAFIFGIVLTFAATSAGVERTNSALRFIKHRIVLRCVKSDSMHWSSYSSTGILHSSMTR